MRVTRRGWAVATIGLMLYFFANQTQVGWLYVLSSLAAGVWLTSLWLPASMLRSLSAARRVNGSETGAELELYAGQPVRIELLLRSRARLPALLLRGREHCALAPPPDRDQTLYVSAIASSGEAHLAYETTCARRGWFAFEPLRLETRAPFGLSRASRDVITEGPDGVLIFPEYRPLERLELFDRRPAVEASLARAGAGGEFVGVREYRPGDPRRSVHWRSTARAGRLIVKEFAEQTQPALTIALDLRAASAIGPDGANTLELAIKVAASLANQAQQRDLPFNLVTNSRRWPAPNGPLSWWALNTYLARVEAGGDEAFDECLGRLLAGTFVATILPAPDPRVLGPLAELQRAGLGVLAVMIDPSAFLPGSEGHAYGVETRRLAAELESTGVATRLVGGEPDWERTLAA